MSTTDLAEARFESLRDDLANICAALGKTIVGQETLIRELVTAVFAGGHVLLEGMPGLGKTHLALALARTLGIELARIQCTPDLMPADITGSEILARGGNGQDALEFRAGPIFAPMVLVDEINRATPKTQSAFLEAMQERSITWLGVRHELPSPFWVIATQNPIELEGTYPLPEAQLDRFLFKLRLDYPDEAALLAMLDVSLDEEPAHKLPALLSTRRAAELVEGAREVVIAPALREAAVRTLMATQPESPRAHPAARKHLRYGASPRGLQALLRAARVRALMDRRAHVASEDLRAVALPALRHRVMLTVESELDGVREDDVLTEVLGACLPWN